MKPRTKPIDPAELRATRELLKLTQGALGRALGVSRVTVNKWENGQTLHGIPAKYRGPLGRLIAGCDSAGEADETALGHQFEATGTTELDDPDGWKDEAEDKATTDEERDDAEHVPVVDLWPEDDDD